jgi:hypothetical protein
MRLNRSELGPTKSRSPPPAHVGTRAATRRCSAPTGRCTFAPTGRCSFAPTVAAPAA